MRIFRPGNIEWNVNSTTHPPCGCWAWAITSELGGFRVAPDGNAHHPHCPRLCDARRPADDARERDPVD